MADTVTTLSATTTGADGVTSTSTQTQVQSTTAGTSGFCGAEERVSTHTCNSVHPATSLDQFGNQAVVWHDNRDGNFEVYFKLFPSKMSSPEQLEIEQSSVDATTGRDTRLDCADIGNKFADGEDSSGFSGTSFPLEARCATDVSGFSGFLVRYSSGRLDVNTVSQTAFLSASGNADFSVIGVLPGDSIRFETGRNAGIDLQVREIIGSKLLRLAFDSRIVTDTNFLYSVVKGELLLQDTCETRLTCGRGASMFPDVVSDEACRYHVLYHDDKSGSKQLYYVQVAPNSMIGATCPNPPPNASGFGEVSPATPNAFRFVSTDPLVVRYFKPTGDVGNFFSYGNKLLPEPLPNTGPSSERIGTHVLYRDFESNDGAWVGISKSEDRVAWNDQIAENPIEPDVVYSDISALHQPGDFGGIFSFSNVAIAVQAPPDMDVDVRTIGIPIVPRCAPDSPAESLSRPRESDLVEAPKRPLPPTFVDPVDVTSFLSSPMVQVRTDEPSRFVLENDKSGTVFTNIVVEDASGDLRRLLFRQEGDGSSLKFVLGLSDCNGGPCAVKPSRATPSEEARDIADGRYKVRLQVWKGADYRLDPSQSESATMSSEMVMEKDFFFDAGDRLTIFSLVSGDLRMEAGRMYFFVPVATDSVEFMLRGVGGGNVVWTTDGSGTMSNYMVPFTLQPYAGMSVSSYYDGFLISPPPQPKAIIYDASNIMTVATDSSIASGAAVPINATVNRPIGLDYNPVTGKIIVSANTPSGLPFSLQQIDEDGNVSNFSNLAGVGNEAILAIVREPLEGSGWTEGDVVLGNGTAGQIVKISPDGTTVQNPWVTLPDAGIFQGGLYFDRTGIFEGDLIAVTAWQNAPKVWRVKSDGSFSLLASVPAAHLEGVITVPEDTDKYGPWAGKVIVGDELSKGMFAVDKEGAVEFFPLPIRPEQMAICEEGTSLYIGTTLENRIWAIPSSALKNSVGNIFIAQEASVPLVQGGAGGGAVYELKWNGSQFVAEAVFFASHIEQINFNEARLNPLNQEPVERDTSGPCGTGPLEATYPRLITRSTGENVYPRMATGLSGITWAVWHSTRDGAEDVYAARYFGDCNVWNSSATGGDDMRVSTFANEGHRAMFPSVAVSQRGEAHVVFQATDSDGKFEIFYSRTTGGGAKFLRPVKLTSSPGDAVMPDVAISYEDGNERITVVWHDNRFGNFEVMSATKFLGKWRSSYQSGSDLRLTNSAGSSMFPRLSSDKDGNIRCTFHGTRTGRNEVYMATYVGLTRSWDSSGLGGKDIKVSNGPLNSLFPDVATDRTGGVAVVWHDDRHTVENPDFHEEVYRTYCPKLGHPGGHFPPLVTNVEERLDVQFDIVDCVDKQPIDLTNVPEVCLKIKSPGATFWRAANNDSTSGKQWSKWQQFKPTYDLDTTVVPWTISCGSGVKEVCVQVQDSTIVGFPICKKVTLAIPPQDFKIEFFQEESLSTPLPMFGETPAAREGDVFVKITAPTPQVLPPQFSVVGRGGHIIVNQETKPIFGATMGASGFFDASGIGSFAGANVGGAFSAAASQQFVGRFHVFREDGLFHVDGLARVVVQPQGLCPSTPSSADNAGAKEECPDEIGVPPGVAPPDFFGTSGMSGPSGTAGPWNEGPYPTWMTIDLTSNDVAIVPPISQVPYKLTIGAIAQPFVLPSSVSGDVVVRLKMARRAVPEWLSSFQSRRVLVQVLEDFFSPSPTVIAAVYVPAVDLPEVEFDPVTGLMTDPTSLESVDTVDITITGVPTLVSGTDYAISIQDDTFYPLLGTYGANAKFFVVGVGSDGFTGAHPYYFRDY